MCSGIALMLGYSSPWARFMRHWCLAGVEFSAGSMSALGSMLVEVPLVTCVCITSNHHTFVPYLRDVCSPQTSSTLRRFIVTLTSWENDIFESSDFSRQGLMRETCDTTMRAFESSLLNAFDPWVSQHTEAAFHTISLFDYLGVLLGKESAKCTSAETNPLVSVMIPTPLDYFHVCGATSVCKTRCKAYRSLLSQEIALREGQYRLAPLSFRTDLESPMFKRYGWNEFQVITVTYSLQDSTHFY
jgi:hypothetical protein